MIEAFLPLIEDSGRIVNVSSGYGQRKNLGPEYTRAVEEASTPQELFSKLQYREEATMAKDKVPCYKVSKAALNRLTQLYDIDDRLQKRNISVSCCCPGWVRVSVYISRL